MGEELPVTSASTDAPTPAVASSPRIRIGALVVAAVFALLYAYDIWEAISNLVEVPVLYAALGFDAASVPWVLLILGVVLPPVVFALALLVGRRRSLGMLALLLLLGLAIVAGASLGIIAFEAALRPAF